MEKHIAKGSKLSKKILSNTNLVCMESNNYHLLIALIILFAIVLGFCLYKLYVGDRYSYVSPTNSYVSNMSNVNKSTNTSNVPKLDTSQETNMKFPSDYNFDNNNFFMRDINDMTDIQAMVGKAKMTGMPAIPLPPTMPRTIGMPPLNPVLRPETLPWVQPVRPNLYDRRVDFALVGYVSRKHYQMMPLYGRMAKYNSNKYEYYVIDTDTNIKIPVYSKNDNELYSNDEIYVNEKRYKVTIYDMNEVRY